MLGDSREQRKLKELVELANISEAEYEKLDWKGRQNYFKAKSKLAKVFYQGKKPYVKPKEVQSGINKK